MATVHDDDLVSKVSIQLQRQARRLPLYNKLLRFDHAFSRARYREHLPLLEPRMHDVYRGLRKTGVVRCTLPELGIPYEAALRVADAQIEQLRKKPAHHTRDFYLVSDEELLARPEPYLFGLAEPLLDLAEFYFGLPVDYLGVNIKREVANGLPVGTRKFHADPEDESVLKIIVYLNDVDRGGGPFECLDAATSARVMRATNYLWGGGCDIQSIRKLVPPSQWVTCTGPRLSVSIADTARCLHRATPPTHVDRYSMTFSYLSRKAYMVFADGKELQRKFVRRWAHMLSKRQLACVKGAPS